MNKSLFQNFSLEKRPLASRGWCPGAHRPMEAADGLIVRIRPPAGRLTAVQAEGLAGLALELGKGMLTLTSRANLQVRGVQPSDHPQLLSRLAALDLVDSDVAAEQSRNIIITPYWRSGDGTLELADGLTSALATVPTLPAKFGFAIDTGPAPTLQTAPADIRLERASDGTLLLRANGAALGLPVRDADAVDRALALANWFLTTGGAPDGRGRMASHLAAGYTPPPSLSGTTPSASPVPTAGPGPCQSGMLAAFNFGDLPVQTLRTLATLAPEIRLTPWRMLFLPDLTHLPTLPGLMTDPASPMPRIFACTGAPNCAQSFAETRPLAVAIADFLPQNQILHVSGCAKGCAYPGAADITLTATPDGLTLDLKDKAKQFFFEKKNQETFAPSDLACEIIGALGS